MMHQQILQYFLNYYTLSTVMKHWGGEAMY